MSAEPKAARVLLITASADEVKSFGGPLARARMGVTLARSATTAIETLQKGAFDAIVLAHPLPDAEPVGACAGLAAVAGCPRILLIDDVDRSREMLGSLPADSRPARCVARPLDGPKLPQLVTELIEASDEPDASVDRRGFSNVLLDLALRSETGVLEARSGTVATRIFVRRGAPVSVEGGSLRETLGRMLVRSGALSERDYERVIQRMTERVIDNEHQRMGEVLIQLGLMSATDVYQALSKQAVEKIVECFAAERVELSFDEMESLPAAIEPLAVPAFPALLVECVKRHFSEDEQSALLLPIAGARMKLRDPAPELKLKGEDARLAASLNGTRSISEVWRGNASARATLAALALLDVLEPVTTHAKAPAPGPTQAPRASLQFTREVITPRKKQPVTASSVVAKAVAANPNETTQVRLGGEDAPASAGRGSEAKARLEAEQHFQSARKLVEREKFDEAAHAMQRAVALRPGEPEYRMFEAWVSYLAARVGARIARAKAVACARKMIEADPRAAKPHAILGRLLLEDGDAKSAEREFEFALVRDPADDDAKKGITQVRGKSK